MRQNQHPDLGTWSREEPPASLDALVRERALAVLERRRAEAPPLTRALSALSTRSEVGARSAAPARSRLLGSKVLGYARALAARGAQVVDGATRLFRRAVAD
jgi:hypothetical protein